MAGHLNVNTSVNNTEQLSSIYQEAEKLTDQSVKDSMIQAYISNLVNRNEDVTETVRNLENNISSVLDSNQNNTVKLQTCLKLKDVEMVQTNDLIQSAKQGFEKLNEDKKALKRVMDSASSTTIESEQGSSSIQDSTATTDQSSTQKQESEQEATVETYSMYGPNGYNRVSITALSPPIKDTFSILNSYNRIKMNERYGANGEHLAAITGGNSYGRASGEIGVANHMRRKKSKTITETFREAFHVLSQPFKKRRNEHFCLFGCKDTEDTKDVKGKGSFCLYGCEDVKEPHCFFGCKNVEPTPKPIKHIKPTKCMSMSGAPIDCMIMESYRYPTRDNRKLSMTYNTHTNFNQKLNAAQGININGLASHRRNGEQYRSPYIEHFLSLHPRVKEGWCLAGCASINTTVNNANQSSSSTMKDLQTNKQTQDVYKKISTAYDKIVEAVNRVSDTLNETTESIASATSSQSNEFVLSADMDPSCVSEIMGLDLTQQNKLTQTVELNAILKNINDLSSDNEVKAIMMDMLGMTQNSTTDQSAVSSTTQKAEQTQTASQIASVSTTGWITAVLGVVFLIVVGFVFKLKYAGNDSSLNRDKLKAELLAKVEGFADDYNAKESQIEDQDIINDPGVNDEPVE